MAPKLNRTLAAVSTVLVLGLGTAAPAALAKHGSDDPVGHHVGDDNGGKRVKVSARAARNGRDDRPGDDNGRRRGRGNDDGPNHR